jgi:NitT/TauT family transport system permease protein
VGRDPDQAATMTTAPDLAPPVADTKHVGGLARGKRSAEQSMPAVWATRFCIIAAFLLAWQYLPDVSGINKRITFLDPFFISSPSRVAARVWDLATGAKHTPLVWHPFFFTLSSALIGTAIAVIAGAAAGLFLSNSPRLERVFRPFVTALNAVPRIAIVPVVVIIAGNSARADIITAITVVVFLVFYNALEGGRSAPTEMINNAKVMGASSFDVMLSVRLPLVLAWTFAAVPNAIAFGLVGSVTAELFTGASGVGQLLSTAVDTADATLTFSVVVILTIAGVALVLLADQLRKLVLPWWHPAT